MEDQGPPSAHPDAGAYTRRLTATVGRGSRIQGRRVVAGDEEPGGLFVHIANGG
jgi:hypothetical protein